MRVTGILLAGCFLTGLSMAGPAEESPLEQTQNNKNSSTNTKAPALMDNQTTNPTTAPKTTNTTTAPKTTIAPKTTNTTIAPKTTNTTTAPKTTIAPKTTNTTIAPKTTNTTTAPKTTNTTIVPKTTNTTIAPKTTNTTIAPKTTNTTIAPKTTPPAPTEAPTPTPSTTLRVGNYTVLDNKTQSVCVMAVMALEIRINTPKLNGTFKVQPNLTRSSGWCTETSASLNLLFEEGFISFFFNKSVADNSVYVNRLNFSLSYAFNGQPNNAVYQGNNQSTHLFAAGIGHCYSCRSDSIFMGNGLHLDVTQDRMQAFNLTKNQFGSSDYCTADRGAGARVAIAVGVVLLILVVIAVAIYVYQRKRSTEGYQPL